MAVSVHGILNGRHIDLESETGLPGGTRVAVRIEPEPLNAEQRKQLAASLFGACADDPTFAEAVADVERGRQLSLPRHVNLDVAP